MLLLMSSMEYNLEFMRWIQILTRPLACCSVFLGKLLNLSDHQFLNL
jgi:hypothetical protein